VIERAHVRVQGLVQGVFFRAEAKGRADSLGVSGWARNLPDGSVEAVFEGPRELVQSLVDWCRRGPRGARVDAVEVVWEPPEELRGFSVE
jgi:acylphosphatase